MSENTCCKKDCVRCLLAGYEAKIRPYLWWQEAIEAGVDIPASPHVWHYNPIAVLQQLWHEGYGQNIAVRDEQTEANIAELHPDIREDARAFINDAFSQGYALRIYMGFRSFEEQDDLYAQGRTEPGSVVTNAEGGESYHNYGLSFDLVEIVEGEAAWQNDSWDEIGDIGNEHGFEWGGDWESFVDRPHFQQTFGFHHSDLLERRQIGETFSLGGRAYVSLSDSEE